MAMQDVMIEMKSTQLVDGERDGAETFVRGRAGERGGAFCIEFSDRDEETGVTAQTVIEMRPDGGVEIRRTGPSSGFYRVSLQRRHLCTFVTSYGELMFGFTGREISFARGESGGRLFLRYDLDTNGMLASENEIDLKYTVLEN